MNPTIASIADELLARSDGKDRFIVALAGPPGAGKSFRSAWLADSSMSVCRASPKWCLWMATTTTTPCSSPWGCWR